MRSCRWSEDDDPGRRPDRLTGEKGTPVIMNFGPSEDLVRQLSAGRAEPNWMFRQRLRGLDLLRSDGVPPWAAFLREIDFGAVGSSDGPPANISRGSTDQPGLAGLEE